MSEPITPSEAISLRAVEMTAAAYRDQGGLFTAAALEALVRLYGQMEDVERGLSRHRAQSSHDVARAALAQFDDDRGHDPEHREAKP